MTTLPQYKINDQVIVLSKNPEVIYSVGIVRHIEKNSFEWRYEVQINNSTLSFFEPEIKAVIFESKDKLVHASLTASEEAVELE